MKNFADKRSASTAFKLHPVAAGCAVFLSVMAAGSAYAQEAAASAPSAQAAPEAAASPAIQTVQVTGIRRGIEAAISVKKNSSSIVEAISAEDIGKLPDSSVADTIARLPGVTAQRSRASGKAGGVSVRGLEPNFNGNLLNGREQASTGNTRSPEFDLFPAELIAGLTVAKTPDATMVGSGLAATIDLKTIQPLDFGKRVIAGSARKDRTGVKTPSTGDGHRYTVSYIDQYMNRTLGLAIGVTSYEDVGGDQRKFESSGTSTATWAGQTVNVPAGFKADTENRSESRDGVSATLQWRPNRQFKSTLDLFYSKGDSALKKTGLEGSIAGSWGNYDPAGALTSASVSNGVANSGTFSGYKGVVRNHLETSEDELKNIGWRNELKAGDWNLMVDLSRSKGTKDSVRYETTAGQAGNTPEASVGSISWTGYDGSNLSVAQFKPSVDYSNRSVALLNDVAGWGGSPLTPQAGYVAMPKITDEISSIRLGGTRDLDWGPATKLHLGANVTNRDKIRAGLEGRLAIKGGDGYATAAVPGNEIGVAGTTGIPIVKFDPRGSLGPIYELARWVDASVLAKDWSVSEDVTTVYAMVDLEGQLGSLPYRGNVGVQYVSTKQATTGNRVNGECTGITEATCKFESLNANHSYNDVLPSANLTFDLGSEQFLRLGAAKVLARPNLEDMRASRGFGVTRQDNSELFTGSGGNPKLEPFRAKALDLSYEKYFGNKAYVSGALFYKKLDTYILRAPVVFDYSPFISDNTPKPADKNPVGFLTLPVNGNGGSLKGFELAANLPLSLVTGYLDGFGIMANHSYTKSDVTLPSSGFATTNIPAMQIPLPGLSKKVSNLRVYYEKHGLQVAWAARKRSEYLGSIPDFQDNSQLTFIKGDLIKDIQASYEIQSGWLKGVNLFVQALNWSNQPYTEYEGGNPAKITYTTTYGRTYQAGLSYKF